MSATSSAGGAAEGSDDAEHRWNGRGGRIGLAQAGAGTAMASEAGRRNSNGLAVAHTLLVARRR